MQAKQAKQAKQAMQAMQAKQAKNAKQAKVWRHYKKQLAVVALVLALAAGSGGTLMLLTDTTSTATNIMTAGNVKISLHEIVDVVDADGKKAQGETINVDDDRDVTMGIIVPGQSVAKQPFVKNTGNTDAYVAIELIFQTGGAVATEAGGKDTDTKALYEDFFKGIKLTNGTEYWRYGDDDWIVAASETQGYDEYHQVYFYRSGSSLNKLSVNTTTSGFIDSITIPDWGNEINDIPFKLAVKAYAIQADYVSPGGNVSKWQEFFAKEFPNLKGDGSATGRTITS
ncbi:MAG: hypothetical protein LBS91_01600 [Clostridiales Family XIII bacterium]|nr:hypothetical protein [Clostridiales Family XIII bacterium]